MNNHQEKFAFIVHSRNRGDLLRVFPLLRFLPNFIFDLITLFLPPFKISSITGLIDAEGNEIPGILIGIPMTAHQLLEKRRKAVARIAQAVRLAEKYGATYIGLGAMTASLSQGGIAVAGHAEKACITTGRTYTVLNISAYVDFCIERFHLKKEDIVIGVVGAAGGIGFGVTAELVRRSYTHFFLIDVERKLDHLKNSISRIPLTGGDLHIEVHHQLDVLRGCTIVITATSSPEIIIESKDVQLGTILINDAQPSDISPDILKERKDVLVIEGGVLHTNNIDCHLHMGLANKNDIFSCLAETLLLASTHYKGRKLINESDPMLHDLFLREAIRLQFSLAPQNTENYLNEDILKTFFEINNRA